MDPTRLLEQFLGGDAKTMLSQGGGKAKQKLDAFGWVGGFAGGAAAGGLLGVLLGSKKVRKMACGAVGYGGAAALAVLAYRRTRTGSRARRLDRHRRRRPPISTAPSRSSCPTPPRPPTASRSS